MIEEIMINEEEYGGTQDDYNVIKEAIDRISSASEEQFEQIKKEKWYNRVLDMVTFSQKGKGRMAEQVGTLAQAQQIVIELLWILSDEDKNISEIVKESQENIQKISEQNVYLYAKIQQLEDVAWGIKMDMDIKRLTEPEKELLSACLYCISEQTEQSSDEQQTYANAVMDYLGIDVQMENLHMVLEKVNINAKKQILNCCMEYMFLKDFTDRSYSEYKDFIREFDIGDKSIEDIKERISARYKLRGREGFYLKFQNSENKNDDELDKMDRADEKTYFEDEEADTSVWKEDYSDIRSFINSAIAEITQQKENKVFGLLRKKTKEKEASLEEKETLSRREKVFLFIRKHNSRIAFDAAVEYLQLQKGEILFTTSGIHVVFKDAKEVKHVKYADIGSGRQWELKTEGTKLILQEKGTGTRIEVEDQSYCINEIEKILDNAPAYVTAKRDDVISEKEWPEKAKCLMGEILVDVYKMYFQKSTLEAFRLFNDLSVTTEQILDLFAYYGNSEPDEQVIRSKIKKFIGYIPYPSEKSAGFLLICKIVAMIQFSEDRPDEKSPNLKKLLKDICDICKLHEYMDEEYNTGKKKSENEKETWEKIWDIGALPYRTLKKKATVKEINEIGLEMAGVAAGVGIPVAISVVDSILFYASLGMAFVPGVDLIFLPAIGTILAGGAVGGGAMKGIVSKISKVKQEDIEKASERELWKAERSYVNLYKNIQSIEDKNIRRRITDEIVAAAGKTDSGIKDCIRAYSTGKHIKDAFYIQAIEEKLSAKRTKNKPNIILTTFDGEDDQLEGALPEMLKRTYLIPIHNKKCKLQHHQVLAIYESKKRRSSALAFTYEGFAITKEMIGDGERVDKFIYYSEITKFKSDNEKSLLYLTIGNIDKKESDVAVSFYNPGVLTELLVRLRQIGVTVFI